MLPCEKNNTSFFAKLQNCEGLDLRDNRGKRHDLAIILLEVTLAILSNRDGKMSSIHRHLQKHHHQLLEFLDLEPKNCVSRAHLPLILEKVSVSEFDRLMFAGYGIKLSKKQKKWFAIDGKELREVSKKARKEVKSSCKRSPTKAVRRTVRIITTGEKKARSKPSDSCWQSGIY
jgi:hypothetical protein